MGFELVLALVDHGLLLVEPVLSDQHLRLELLLLAHSAEFETAVGLVAEEVVGHVGEDAVVVVDREVQLGVRSPLLRLGNVFLLENLVLAFTEGSDCQDQPLLVGVVLLDGVDARRQKVKPVEVDVEFVDQHLLTGGSHTLAVNDVGDFEAVDLLGLDVDEVLATHELAVNIGENPTASNEEFVVGFFVLD